MQTKSEKISKCIFYNEVEINIRLEILVQINKKYILIILSKKFKIAALTQKYDFVMVFLPILGIILNIRTVNFRKYLKSLMKGVGMERYFLETSIFI